MCFFIFLFSFSEKDFLKSIYIEKIEKMDDELYKSESGSFGDMQTALSFEDVWAMQKKVHKRAEEDINHLFENGDLLRLSFLWSGYFQHFIKDFRKEYDINVLFPFYVEHCFVFTYERYNNRSSFSYATESLGRLSNHLLLLVFCHEIANKLKCPLKVDKKYFDDIQKRFQFYVEPSYFFERINPASWKYEEVFDGHELIRPNEKNKNLKSYYEKKEISYFDFYKLFSDEVSSCVEFISNLCKNTK
jgi:hypothetical protein